MNLKKVSKDGVTAETELDLELKRIFEINFFCAFASTFLGLISLVITMALTLQEKHNIYLGLSMIWFTSSSTIGMPVNAYFASCFDLDEGYTIRRWCRKKIVSLSVINPFQNRCRIHKVVKLLENEDLSKKERYKDGVSELESELRVIFGENAFYGAAWSAFCLNLVIFMAALSMSGVEPASLSLFMKLSGCLLMSSSIVLWCGSYLNFPFLRDRDFGTRNKAERWFRKRMVLCSVIFPYQDCSRIERVLALLIKEDEDEEEKRRKLEQESLV